jgi:hypothetical protein
MTYCGPRVNNKFNALPQITVEKRFSVQKKHGYPENGDEGMLLLSTTCKSFLNKWFIVTRFLAAQTCFCR